MTISKATGDEISEAEVPLLDDVVNGAVDFKGRPAVRSKSGCWKSASFILGTGLAERFAYYGISCNLVSFLTKKLGQPAATAAAQLNAWYGISSLLPILGAFVADSFAGRFRTVIVACVLYILALGFLSLSASLSSHSSKCTTASENVGCFPTELWNIFFFFSLYLISFAQGGLSPCAQAFGADQFDEEDEYEKNVGWELGFGIPAIAMCLALVLFLSGSMTYRFRVNSDGRNTFVRINRVLVRAAKNWKAAAVAISVDEEGQHNSAQFRFLDKALLTPDGSIDETICNVKDVEYTKAILRLVPIWFSSLAYAIVFAQPSTLFTKQASTIDLHLTPSFKLPAASLQMLFLTGSVPIFLPLYDRVFVPITRAITKKPSGISTLQRIGTGFVLSLISITSAALVEQKRLALAREYELVDMPNAMIPIKLFYDQVPGELKSIGLAMYLSILGVGSLLSSFLVSTVQELTSRNGQGGWFADNLNRAHLDYFYWLLAGLCAAELTAFLYFAKYFIYKRTSV
ncbi:UNVERIFIED_CONTAM: protein NRT1/ PTR FAMILY 5.10 [Sesamum calycinum]|uniref:Protein NRT1/ PTR FAMILY 5.10 n=1 Tax=Sesamum calycinum TaxID=2727403 RepID=A0AAW2P4W0_9LAMI